MGRTEDSEDDALLRAVAAAPAVAPPGETIGGFRLLDVLGKGGMGIVYRARDERLERDVALKMIAAGAVDDGRERKRLLREAKAAAAVSHPNVATVHEVGEHDGRVFIVMELVPGKTLRALLADGPLDAAAATAIARDVARALAKAHERGIVHRDLKPENVIVGEQTKVLDFGLARVANATNASIELAGTPGYMPPEQLRGEATDARSDVFSFGVLLHEMLTGTRPPARGARTKIPPHLERLVDRCLAESPGDRPDDASALVAALEPGASKSNRTTLVFAALVVALVATAIVMKRSPTPAAPVVHAEPAVAPAASTSAMVPSSSASPSASVPQRTPSPKATARAGVTATPTPSPSPSSSSSSAPRRDPLGDQF